MNNFEVTLTDYKGEEVIVPWFQLLQWKGAIGLEAKGMKHSRGSVTACVRRKLSAPRNYSRTALLVFLTEAIEDVKKQTEEAS